MIGANGTTGGSGVPRQICFTRVGKQEAGAGWQTVNVSPGLPAGAVSAFEGLQNGNVRYVSSGTFDPEDTAKIVTELRIQGHDAFLTRIKYGVREEVGRAAMGAQGFVFPLEQLVADPQSVLNVEYTNFALAADQTLTTQIVEATAAAPATFSVAPHRSMGELRADLAALGVNDDQKFADLLTCVVITLFSRAKETLTIHCDCSETTIRTVMACLYAAIPPALRGKLTFSTYLTNNGMPTTIVFAHPSRAAARVFDLATGTTNVLTKGARHRYEQYQFMIVPASNFNDRLSGFFTALEAKIAQLGDSAEAADMDMYQLAYDLLVEEQTGTATSSYEKCVTRLMSLLVFARLDRMNDYCEHLIAVSLTEFLDNQYELNDVLNEQLGEAIGKAKTPELVQVGERYTATVIKAKTPAEGAQYLAQAYPDRTSQGFLSLRELLARDPDGQAVLRELYVAVLGEQLKVRVEQEATAAGVDLVSEIAAYRDEALQSVADHAAVMQVVADSAQSYLVARIQPDQDPGEVVQNAEVVLGRLLRNESVSDDVWHAVVAAYWKKFTFNGFKFDQVPSSYEPLEGGTHYPEYVAIGYAQQCLQAFNAGDVTQVAEALQRYRDFADLDPAKKITLNNLMLNYCLQHRAQYAVRPIEPTGDEYQPQGAEAQSAAELDVWIHLIRALKNDKPQTVAEFLLRQGMLPAGTDERFFALVGQSTLLKGPELDKLADGMALCSESGDPALVEGANTVLEDLASLQKLRDQEAKQAAKDEKRAEKEARKEARKANGGFLGGLLFGGNTDETYDDEPESMETPMQAPAEHIGRVSGLAQASQLAQPVQPVQSAQPVPAPTAPVVTTQPTTIQPRSVRTQQPVQQTSVPQTPVDYRVAQYAQQPPRPPRPGQQTQQQTGAAWDPMVTSQPHQFDYQQPTAPAAAPVQPAVPQAQPQSYQPSVQQPVQSEPPQFQPMQSEPDSYDEPEEQPKKGGLGGFFGGLFGGKKKGRH
ncbi:hypothetical protein [Bifidobacterium callimiconis]|uniref:Tegument protein n=1 Tax=Bifidobacterium callimiconis TaxID=2306973 RepID=A0A430FC04_9BIFI|nr:hypothetical protein [Bifidobacterium callimiconis]MBT1177692.1 hypothetical protein [Bifidobacterium callimiconis]RSX50367.1 tegument protein [Bifidobacterium callimiconis]